MARRRRRARTSRLRRARCASALKSLDDVYKRFLYPQSYVVGMEAGLAAVRDELVRRAHGCHVLRSSLEGKVMTARKTMVVKIGILDTGRGR